MNEQTNKNPNKTNQTQNKQQQNIGRKPTNNHHNYFFASWKKLKERGELTVSV